MARTTEQETVRLTDHATERTNGGDKAKCRLPESVIKTVILQRKGKQYLDTKSDTIHFLYNATVIVADYKPERHVWIVPTVYRDPTAEAKRRGTRYREINVNEVVEMSQSSGP